MAILNIKLDSPGEVGVVPRIIKIDTNNTVAEVLTAGFLNQAVQLGFTFAETDMALVSTKTAPGAVDTQVGYYEVAKNGTNWSLEPAAGAGDVTLPTTANHIATYTNVTGGLSEDAATAINDGNIQAGLSGSAGRLISYPATAARGSLEIRGRASVGNTLTSIQNASMAQATTITIPDPLAATGTFALSALATPSPGSNLIHFNVACGQAALAAAGTVVLVAAADATAQYQIISLWINDGGTDFAGGGGDRLGQVTDGTTVYSVVPAATMQALVNAGWGFGTDLPFPAGGVALNTLTVAGDDIVFAYSGGTTDYTAGSVVVSGVVARVA